MRERVNEGGPETQAYPHQLDGVNPRQTCPGMIGPISDQYYCLDPAYGYCDRRSGTCFCNVGYQGRSCEECTPTHIRMGGLCYPRKLCKNSCSGQGVCDYVTGTCVCSEHRGGEDCSELMCQHFDEYCTECNNSTCLACYEGFNVDPTQSPGAQCQSCSRFDPRCRTCDNAGCTSCMDLVLTSVRRSGKRTYDPPLPQDEREREFSVKVPFNSLQTNAFDESESFRLMSGEENNAAKLPLKDHAIKCDQGISNDVGFNCSNVTISHVVCGHEGVVTLSSPEYEIWENEGAIRITVLRSGGGVGLTTVDYIINHLTTDDSDLTPTHFYTTDQTITFLPGEIEKSFLITINDDRLVEGNERFMITLANCHEDLTLGVQRRAYVTILDDDRPLTNSQTSHVVSTPKRFSYFKRQLISEYTNSWEDVNVVETTNDTHTRQIAGIANEFQIKAHNGVNLNQQAGGDVFLVEAAEIPKGSDGYISHRVTRGVVSDSNSGFYGVSIDVTKAGLHHLNIYLLVPGGLLGKYYDDAFFTSNSLSKTRVDSVLNFTWGEGRVSTFGSDFVSVNWQGRVVHDVTEDVLFTVVFDDDIRVYLDGRIVIDKWGEDSDGVNNATGVFSMEAGVYHKISIEYREIRGVATCQLMWSSPTMELDVIPSANLFHTEHINGSPFNYTVVPTAPSSVNSIARGIGLNRGIATKPHRFSIESRDEFNNWRGKFDVGFGGTAAYENKMTQAVSSGMDGFHGYALLIDDTSGGGYGAGESERVYVSVTYNPDTRLYDCVYHPQRSGVYSLNVFLSNETLANADQNKHGEHIFGSPFKVTTSPSFTSPQNCDVWGGYGNCASDAVTPGEFDKSNTDAVLPNWGGWNAYENDCSGINHGLTNTIQSFMINSRDINNNNRSVTGDSWEVVAHSQEDPNSFAVGWVIDNEGAPGQYIGYVKPEKSGRHLLSVTLNGVHAKGSPFELYVRHNVAYGPQSRLITDIASVGFSEPFVNFGNTFTAQLVDEMGNDMKTSSYPYNPVVTADISSDFGPVSGSVAMNGDGTFTVTYSPRSTGEQQLTVVVNGEEIIGSPFTVNVQSADLTGSTSVASGAGLSSAMAGVEASFVVEARDLEGNTREFADGAGFVGVLTMVTVSTRPPDFDQMVNSNWGSSEVVNCVSVHSGGTDGLYTLSYNATISGDYSLAVTSVTDNQPISGSPFSVTVVPNVASGTESIITGSGTRTGTAGVLEPIEIYLRDVFDNHLYAGGDRVRVESVLVSGHHENTWESVGREARIDVVNGLLYGDDEQDSLAAVGITEAISAVDYSSGKYYAHYTPTISGDYTISAFLDTPGGLWGSYFTDDKFVHEHLSLTKHDLAVDYNWGVYSPFANNQPHDIVCLGPTGNSDNTATNLIDESNCVGNGLAMPDDHFSVEWKGYLEADHDEEYQIGVVCDNGSKAGVWVDGIEVGKFGECGGQRSRNSGKIILTAGERVEVKVRYAHGRGESFVKLMWESPSQGSWHTVSGGNLFRSVLIQNVVHTATYVPNISAARKSTAVGESVSTAIAGVPQQFVVECRDEFGTGGKAGKWGNLQLAGGGCGIDVVARGSTNGAAGGFFEGSVSDNGDGTYTVDYTPAVSGKYYLQITAVGASDHNDVGSYYHDLSVANHHILGSPFILDVAAGATTASTSHADYLGVWNVNDLTEITIWSRDSNGNRKTSGGDVYEVFLSDDGVDRKNHVDGDANIYFDYVLDNEDGTYTAGYVPKVSMENWYLHVFLLDGGGGGGGLREEVLGSPYDITIYPNTPVGENCVVSSGWTTKDAVDGAGTTNAVYKFSASSGNIRSFYVSARDEENNDWWTGGANFVGRLRGETNELDVDKRLVITDTLNGKYKVDVEVNVPGTYEIDILLANNNDAGLDLGSNIVKTGGGLLGEYFNSVYLDARGASPVMSRVDERLDFEWGEGLVGLGQGGAGGGGGGGGGGVAADYVGVKWSGFIKPFYSESVRFYVENVNSAAAATEDHARLFIDDVLILDTKIDGAESDEVVVVEGLLHSIKIEWATFGGASGVRLMWGSRNFPKQLVATERLFWGAEKIDGSPFELVVV